VIHPGTARSNCPFRTFAGNLARKMGRTTVELVNAGRSKEDAIAAAIAKHENE